MIEIAVMILSNESQPATMIESFGSAILYTPTCEIKAGNETQVEKNQSQLNQRPYSLGGLSPQLGRNMVYFYILFIR